jgi:hypothetical protein
MAFYERSFKICGKLTKMVNSPKFDQEKDSKRLNIYGQVLGYCQATVLF